MAGAARDLVPGLKFVLRGPAGLTSLCQPQVYEPGEWVEAVGPLVPGSNGIHFLRSPAGVLGFMIGEQATSRAELWWSEAAGVAPAPVRPDELGALGLCDNGGLITALARRCRLVAPAWDAATCRSLAADLAECAVREVWEHVAPTDRRPQAAIAAARAFARGDRDVATLQAASAAAALAALGPSGLGLDGWRDNARARWAALAAARCAELIPPACTAVYLVKACLLAARDAGAAWSACVACAERVLALPPVTPDCPVGRSRVGQGQLQSACVPVVTSLFQPPRSRQSV